MPIRRLEPGSASPRRTVINAIGLPLDDEVTESTLADPDQARTSAIHWSLWGSESADDFRPSIQSESSWPSRVRRT